MNSIIYDRIFITGNVELGGKGTYFSKGDVYIFSDLENEKITDKDLVLIGNQKVKDITAFYNGSIRRR